MADAVEAVRDAFVTLSRSTPWQPQRLASPDGRTLIMAASDGSGGGTLAKAVSLRPENRRSGLPTIISTALWLDGETGQTVAIIDGAALTSLRTGAASGVATAELAADDAKTLAMIGAGSQAPEQVRGVCSVREIEEIRVTSLSGDSAFRLTKELAQEYPEKRVLAIASVESALEGAEIVCCATTATAPLFSVESLAERVHVNAIGSFRPDMCEVGVDTLAQASIVAVEQVAAALVEAGDIIRGFAAGVLAPESLIELGDLIANGATDIDGITVYKSVGVAVEDWAVAELAVARALTREVTHMTASEEHPRATA